LRAAIEAARSKSYDAASEDRGLRWPALVIVAGSLDMATGHTTPNALDQVVPAALTPSALDPPKPRSAPCCPLI